MRAEVRLRRSGYAGIAVVVAIGATAALGAIVGAWRTDRAYPSFLERNQVEQLVVNPSIGSAEMDAALRRLDGVTAVHSDTLMIASALSTEPKPLRELLADAEDAWSQVRASTDGRYVDTWGHGVSANRAA